MIGKASRGWQWLKLACDAHTTIYEELLEVVLQITAAVVPHDLFSVVHTLCLIVVIDAIIIVQPTEVWKQIASEDGERGALPDPVGAEQTEHVPLPGRR